MKVHQFRCWPSQDENADKGYSNITASKLFSGSNIFKDGSGAIYSHIKQIGIQGAPGTTFWLNSAQSSSNADVLRGIKINWTGIFELDLTEIGGEINSLVFSQESKDLYYNNDSYKLIVDILYDNGGVS